MHLPLGCQDNGTWRCIVIPSYLQYLACQDTDKDVWTVDDDEAVSIQQEIWNFVYGDKVPHIVTVQGPVFALVSVSILLLYYSDYFLIQIDQRVCEWRGGFASAALSVVNAFFDDNKYESDDSCQEFARSALESWEFLYRDVFTTKDGEVSVLLLK